jgi:voltage-gated potassium channel
MSNPRWKARWHEVIFGTSTRGGQLFDMVLLWVILISVVAVVLESIPELEIRYPYQFFLVECVLTGLFTIEYVLRIVVSPKPSRYIFSGWGLIDFLSIMPFYVGLIITDYHYFLVLRLLRLLRVFRILKLFRFLSEAQFLYESLRASAYRIGVFISGVFAIVILLGTLMYVVEGHEYGFTSIPQSIYWTIVTITTVGYGDITPHTFAGKLIASFIMLSGYAIIAIPTGIVTVEMTRQRKKTNIDCEVCGHSNDKDSKFCSSCGNRLTANAKHHSGRDNKI